MSEISRRKFLEITILGASSLGIASFLGSTKRIGNRGFITCRACKAHIVESHGYSERGHRGYYCPNCGIEMQCYNWHLDSNMPRHHSDDRTFQTAAGGKFWNYSQVPFPNRNLIIQTNKPEVIFSDIKL